MRLTAGDYITGFSAGCRSNGRWLAAHTRENRL